MRRLRSAAAIEVCVRCDDNELQPVRYPDRDHVAFEQFANSYPGVKPAANDVRYRVISRDLEIYLGILRLKTRDDRSYNQIDRWRRRGDPQLPARLVTEVVDGFQGGFVILKDRTQARQEVFAHLSDGYTSRGALDEAN